MKFKELTFVNGLSSVFFRENKFSRSGKYIQPNRKFGKLSNSFNYVCLTFDDIFSSHITRFAVGWGGSNINLIKKGLIHLYSKIYYVWLKSEAFEEKKISRQKPKNWKSLRKLTSANPTNSNFSRFQTFHNLPKNHKIAKLCFEKACYFKVSHHRTTTATNAVPKEHRYK